MSYGAKTLRLRIPSFSRSRYCVNLVEPLVRQHLRTIMAATNRAIGAVNPDADKTLKLENVSGNLLRELA